MKSKIFKILLVGFITFFPQINYGQEVTTKLVKVIKLEYKDCNGNIIPSYNFNKSSRFYEENKITTKLTIEGDTSGYSVSISQDQYIYKGCMGMDTSEIYKTITLKNKEIEMFQKVIWKYIEWHKLALSKNINLAKKIYSTTNKNEISCYYDNYSPTREYDYFPNRTIFKTHTSKVKWLGYNYDNGKLEMIAEPEERSMNFFIIILDKKFLTKLKAIIESDQFEKELNKIKKISKSWNEFTPLK